MRSMNVFHNSAIFIGLLLLMPSCKDDFISTENNNNGVNLIAPAFPAIGETESSRTSYTDNGKIQTSWKVGDVIYIGSPEGQTNEKTMTSLISSGVFTTFECTQVNSDGKAVFSGDKLPEKATMAIYGDKSVIRTYNNGFYYNLDNCKLVGDMDKDLSSCDLLCAKFDKATNTLGKFNRGAALVKIELHNFSGKKGNFAGFSSKTRMVISCGSSTNKCFPRDIVIKSDGSMSATTVGSKNRDIIFRYFKSPYPTVTEDVLTLYTFVAPTVAGLGTTAMNVTVRNQTGNTASTVTDATEAFTKSVGYKTIKANQAINLTYSDDVTGNKEDSIFVVKANHPYLFWNENNNDKVLSEINSGKYSEALDKLRQECDAYLTAPLLERVLTGRRLLFVSQEAETRIIKLSFMWRVTGDNRYAERAAAEMLNVCKFSDWNPSHFLDVAEMSTGVAIGYDWLYHYLSPESRETIEEALYKKSASLCLKSQSWMTWNNNWNQICNAGTVLAAMVVSNRYPKDTKTVIQKALQTILTPMNSYGPNGSYGEGPGYWGYGTTFNVIMLSAIETAYNGEVALPLVERFMKSAYYNYNIVGPSGNVFNYGDNKPDYGLAPVMFWFASKLDQPQLVSREMERLQTKGYFANSVIQRYLPFGIIWASEIENLNESVGNENMPLVYFDSGTTPIVTMRTSWDDKTSWFAAMKGGKPNNKHSQMDIGTFVLDAQGERWIMDMGMDSYTVLEANGLDIWNMNSQTSERWDVCRNRNQSHNTLTFNDELQVYNKSCGITLIDQSENLKSASINLTHVYKQQSVNRKISLYNDKFVVNDAITTGETASTLRWNLVTDAEITIDNVNKTVQLQKNGKTMNINFNGNNDLEVKTWSSKPRYDFEIQNDGIYFVGFESSLQANTDYNFEVTFHQ